jgi:hypothetical protein
VFLGDICGTLYLDTLLKLGSYSELKTKCVHTYVNAKMIPAETIPGMGGGEDKESSGGGGFKYDISDTL